MNPQSRRNEATVLHAAVIAVCALMVTLMAACAVPTTPVWLSEGVDTCQKSIASEGFKLEKKIFGALKKCTDTYRQKIVDGDPVSEASVKCDTALAKVLTFPDVEGKSAMAKAKLKLDALAAPLGKCPFGDSLIALGHPPASQFGDLWARLVMVQSLKQAVDQMTALVGDSIDIFARLQAGGCASCAQIASSPCTRSTCRLVPPSGMGLVQVGLPLVVNGDLALDVCTNPAILGTDIAVFSGAKQRLQQIGPLGGEGQCVRLGAARGFIAGTGSSRPTVAVETCVDHIYDNFLGGECDALLGAPVCSTPQADVAHIGVTTSGHCLQLNTSAPSAGQSFLLASVESHSVCTLGGCAPDTRGPDGVACTDDDLDPVARFSVPLTTDSATTTILDADNVEGATIASFPISGSAVTIDPTDKRFAGAWVTALPGVHGGNTGADESAFLSLECD